MALIGDIRRNPWILIVFIALGLGGFIFMDSFASSNSALGSQSSNIGEINGNPIDQRQFNMMHQTVYNNSGDAFTSRNVVWNYFVEDAILQEETGALGGLSVSKSELTDLIFGTNVSPIVRARFSNPATGQVDYAQINSLKTRLNDGAEENLQLRNYWSFLEKEVMKERTQSKLGAMIQKGMYAPTWQLNQIHAEQNQQVDFSYVRIPYGDIDDVELTDSDYSAYINQNKATLTRDEETRRVEYVAFDILPTSADSAALRTKLADTKTAWSTTDNDTTFVSSRLGVLDGAYVSRDQINDNVANALFGQPTGTIYGPYQEGDSYRIAKLMGEQVVPDSVKSRHILLRGQSQAEVNAAITLMDSIKTAIESRSTTFAAMAAKYGTDGTKETGGDLGYTAPGGMVKQFNDMIFYQAKKGELNVVATQFGLHLVEVTGQKYITRDRGARIAYISEQIIPSESTMNAEYKAALQFVSENRTLDELRASAASKGLSTETAGPFAANDYVFGSYGSNQTSRDIIQFAFAGGTDVNEVSAEIYTFDDPVTRISNQHVIAALVDIAPEGLPSVSNIKSDIENQVLNMKKAAMLVGKISATDLNAIASEYDSQVDEVANVSFSSGFAAGLGSEPKVIAAAFDLEEGQTSKAIEGNNGVYVVNVTRKSAVTTEPNIASLRKSTGSSIGLQTTSALMQSMKKDADIEDARSKFF